MTQKAVLMFALIFPVLASAQGATQCPSNVTFCFDGELVEATTTSPSSERLVVRERMMRRSLIEVRHHFFPELVKSVENR